ncbi:MAG: hypothetical protein WCO53_05510, partial [Deltaproteobacteria bacterium]
GIVQLTNSAALAELEFHNNTYEMRNVNVYYERVNIMRLRIGIQIHPIDSAMRKFPDRHLRLQMYNQA